MPVTVVVNNITVSLLNGTAPQIQDTLDQRSTASFTVYDALGAGGNPPLHFTFGMQVTITDSVAGLLFSGYVNDSTETNLFPRAAMTHAINCIDQHYLADKRVAQKDYVGFYAGDIVTDMCANYLSAEGVTSSYAQQLATTQSDFATGTLSGVTASNSIGGGDLELSPAGVTQTKAEQTASDWASNLSLSGLDASSASLCLASHAALKLAGTAGLNFGNAFLYQQFWTGSYTIQSTDMLTYKVWINSSSPQIMCGIDFTASNGTTTATLRDSGAVDQNGLLAHPKQDLSGFANDQWYYRTISLSSLVGYTFSYMAIAFEGDTQGTYTGYVSDVNIYASSGGVPTTKNLTVYASSGTHTTGIALPSNVRIADNGYSNTSLTAVVAYEQTGTRTTNTISLTPANIYKNSLISWTQSGLPASATAAVDTIPAGTSLTINTSVDGGATWQAATNFGQVPGLLPGASLVGRTIQTQQVFAITGKDPTSTPTLSSLTWTLVPSYVATKHDAFKAYATQSDFNSGTKTNVTSLSGGGIQLTGSQRSWLGGSVASQTMFGNGTFSQTIFNGTLGITSTTGAQAFSRLDFAGTWGSGDFTASIDIQVNDATAHEWSGLTYLTSSWSNLVNSFGYRADVNTTSINLSRGGNGSSSGPTAIGTGTGGGTGTAALSLKAGDWHTLTVSYTQSTHTHKVYLDGVLYITATGDSTYTTAGNIAACFNNSQGTTQTTYFQNFGVMPSTAILGATPIPSWVSPSMSLGGITVENSIVQWQATQPNGSTIVVNARVNGGAYQACTNGAVIPGLTPGTVLTNGTVQFQVLMQTPNTATTPVFSGLSAWVLSAYSSSGSRISPGLNLNNVGRIGSSLVSWNALQPTNTNLFIDTSLDQKNWTNIGSGAQGSGPIAGISNQPDPIEDTFTSDTSSFYVNTSQTNGTSSTWTWDTAFSRVEASGGSTGLLLYSSVTTEDIDMVTDMDTSDAGGVVWRVFNTSNFYDLVICDASSASPNQAILYKVASNGRTTLGTYSSLAWTRGTPHRIRVTMLGPIITVYFDGAIILTYTDNHPLGAGQVGLRNNTFSGQSSANFYYFRIQQLGDSVLNTIVYTRQRLVSTDPTVSPQLEDLIISARSPDIASGAFIPSTTFSVYGGSTNTIASDLDDLAKQSNYWWKIRTNKMLFQPHNGTLSPFCITGSDIQTAWGTTVVNDGSLFRTTPYILGGLDTTLSSNEQYKTDGITKTFTLNYPIDSIVSLSTGAKSYTFGIKGVDTGKDFYYTLGNNTINQDATETPLPPGLLLTPVYYGQVNVVATVSNAQQIAAQAALEGTSGIIEVPETASGLNRAAATQLASSRLIQYGITSKTLTFTTPRTGLAVGQLLSVFLPQHNLLDFQFLITGLSIQWRRDMARGFMDATPYFTVTAVAGPIANAWSATLANLSR